MIRNILFAFITMTGLYSEAKTFTLSKATIKIKSEIQINSVDVVLSCSTDNFWGDGGRQTESSDVVPVQLMAFQDAYQMTIPKLSVRFNTFGRSFYGCDLHLLNFDGVDPKLNLPLEQEDWSVVQLSSGKNSAEMKKYLLVAGERGVLTSSEVNGKARPDLKWNH